jgi:Recombinase
VHSISVNALTAAPYGYRYIDKHTGGGEASLDIHEEEAIMVRQIFSWIVQERLSIGEVCRRLGKFYPLTRTGNTFWNKSVIWDILRVTFRIFLGFLSRPILDETLSMDNVSVERINPKIT